VRCENIDTDGLLDICSECKARGKFIYDDALEKSWKIQCSECANSTECYATFVSAMVEWNVQQRKEQRHENN